MLCDPPTIHTLLEAKSYLLSFRHISKAKYHLFMLNSREKGKYRGGKCLRKAL